MSASVFPARAGMSPETAPRGSSSSSVPRASGDEPRQGLIFQQAESCSPRERG